MNRTSSWARAVTERDSAAFQIVAARHSEVGDAVLPRLTRLADHSKLWFGFALALAATRRPRYR
ncbi:MAG: phosphoesterase, partial [Actinomycetota bacterium]|nr:phosphoesterase [Actinomycetota bacterium]